MLRLHHASKPCEPVLQCLSIGSLTRWETLPGRVALVPQALSIRDPQDLLPLEERNQPAASFMRFCRKLCEPEVASVAMSGKSDAGWKLAFQLFHHIHT